MNFRAFAIGAAALMASTTALAGPKDDVLDAFGQCAAIRDDPARLACYDSLVPRVKQAVAPAESKPIAAIPAVPSATPPVTVAPPPPPPIVAAVQPPVQSAPPTPQEQESWFGRNVGSMFDTEPEKQTTPEKFGSDKLPAPTVEEAQASTPQPLDSITAGVSDLAFTPFGQFIVFLDNGQIWRQLQGDADRAHFKKDPKANKVTISRGSLGSYNLTINDSVKLFKVTRVK